MELFWFLVSYSVISSVAGHLGIGGFRHRRLASSKSAGLQDNWVEQKIDHFDENNTVVWKQRYLVDDQYFTDKTGPIFLWIEGEGPMDGITDDPTKTYAENYKALCIGLEHRFYGQSQPTGDLTVESLQYLSSEQALADIAHFVEWFSRKNGLTNNKWVVIGGSYAGSLAAWARLKYPHLIHAALSESGPVLAQVNFKGYDRVVRESLAASNSRCPDNVHKGILAVLEKLKNPSEVDELESKFKLCSKPRNERDVQTFMLSLAFPMMFSVQNNGYGDQNHVNRLCGIMVSNTVDIVDRYGEVADIFRNIFNKSCIGVSYDEEIQLYKNTSTLADRAIERTWTYQTCTEFGFFKTSSSQNDLFGPLLDLGYFVNFCKDIFGDGFDYQRVQDGVKKTNANYGGLAIVNEVSNVVFVHGSLDPWHVLGVYTSSNPNAPAFLISGAAHCPLGDGYDSPEGRKALEQVGQILGQWLLTDSQ